MTREVNAPQPTEAEISRAFDRLDTDRHRRPTAPAVPAAEAAAALERKIASDTRRTRLRAVGEAWVMRGAVVSAYVALALSMWLAARGR